MNETLLLGFLIGIFFAFVLFLALRHRQRTRGQPILSVGSLPDFEKFPYKMAVPPSGSRIVAWTKLQECERRLAMYNWAETLNDPGNPQFRVLLDDSVSAFLMTFEATIQFLRNQYETSGATPSFEDWLRKLPEHNISIAGVRTLRHLAAHLESKRVPRHVSIRIHEDLRSDSSSSEMSCMWRLPAIQAADLTKVRSKLLDVSQLNTWNGTCASVSVGQIFADCMQKLREILLKAEKVI